MAELIEPIKNLTAQEAGNTRPRPYPLGALADHQRRQILCLIAGGASIGELLAFVFCTWLNRSDTKTAKHLMLTIGRVIELRKSAAVRLAAEERRHRKENRIAQKGREENRAGWRRYSCTACGATFTLFKFDPQICPECTAPALRTKARPKLGVVAPAATKGAAA